METDSDMVGSEQFVSGMPVPRPSAKPAALLVAPRICDWVIPDRKRVVSGRHAQVSFEKTAHSIWPILPAATNLLKPAIHPAQGPGRSVSSTVRSLRCRRLRDPRSRVQDRRIQRGSGGRPQDAGSIIPG